MLMSGASHRIVRSLALSQYAVALYKNSVPSSSARKPWAKPAGIQNCLRFCALSSTAAHLPKVVEPWRMSTATSQAAPRTTRTSLPWACGAALVVQAAQHILVADRVVVLHEIHVEAGGFAETGEVEALEERAALVLEYARFEHHEPFDVEAGDLHQRASLRIEVR